MKALLADPCCIAFIAIAVIAGISALARYVYSRLSAGERPRRDLTKATL